MMKTKTLFLVIPALAALLPLTANAQSINDRQHDQQHRIVSGLRKGTITGHEATKLEEREGRIARQEAYARRTGGHLSEAERLRIQHELNGTSHAIYGQAHDRGGVHHTAPVNSRQWNQQWRIRQGVHSGALTPAEAHRLQEREKWVRQVEAHDRRTGHHLTEAERRNLEHRLNNTSHAITNQKHDAQHRR